MVSQYLIRGTVFNNLDVLPVLPTHVVDSEWPDLACFKLANNLTPEENSIPWLEQEQSLWLLPFRRRLGSVTFRCY